MDPMAISGILIFILPIIGFPIILLMGKFSETFRKYSGVVATSLIFLSFLLSYYVYLNVSNTAIFSYPWFYNFTWGIYLDPLSISMALMVSGVSFLIHMFAIGYMGRDPNKHLYFAETSLFTGGMLGVVLSSNLVMLFLFWELVGLCSMLLIGFWWHKPNAASAAKKAFIVTRVGDMMLILGLAILFWSLYKESDPLSISTIIQNASSINQTNLALATVLILGGAAGKSAQFPLHVWIPDAMEGPTTVSALIHAATMVTAGIYLVARLFPIYMIAIPAVGYIVLYMGAITLFIAGTLGMVMNDIKRVLAYSTISQLGYMLTALGLGAVLQQYTVGISIYHLIVHSFLKALLFLSAGAILYSLLDTRDIRKMGGLWKKMPITITAMFIGSLTLVGFPPTAGYFSKDEIVSLAYYLYQNTGNIYPWIILVIGVLLTTIYTFRMFFVVALGKPNSYAAEHARDPPWVMIVPLIVLSILSLIYGIFQDSFYSYVGSFSFSINNVFVEYIPFIMVLIGIFLTYEVYVAHKGSEEKIAKSSGILYRILKAKYYLDYFYTNIIAERVIVFLAYLFSLFDKYVVDGFVNLIGYFMKWFSGTTRKIQTGVVQNYAAIMIIGILAFLLLGLFMGVI